MRSSRPRPESLQWVEQALGRGARVVAARVLTGGLTSLVHALTVERSGRRSRYVLRSWPADSAHQDWILRAVADETAILTALERSDVPAPQLVASTREVAAGGPAVLMTRVPGRVLLMPRNREHWLLEMAQMLARIHELEVAGGGFESWLDADQLTPPADASRADVWQEAFALFSQPRTATRTGFIHRDYQHFNLLWSRERLTGVVDWGGARVGPPDVDVGHCRLNLTLLFSAQVAERFRELYEAASGRAVDPYWDVHALLSYGPDWKHFLPLQIAGRAPLEVEGMTRRMEEVLTLALRRT
ncbi:MAG TPA: aminoglycoside phosphotransferase family protein [Vicinamibacterales bacterium]|nr:aminoglycoside phosphotransferase family protein [Vicinamibacterales bacterium]